jgi:hypothetical protein
VKLCSRVAKDEKDGSASSGAAAPPARRYDLTTSSAMRTVEPIALRRERMGS